MELPNKHQIEEAVLSCLGELEGSHCVAEIYEKVHDYFEYPLHKYQIGKALWGLYHKNAISRDKDGFYLDFQGLTPNNTVTEINYKTSYMKIASLVGSQFPECEITTVDMVRLLIHENDTLRMALKLPTRTQVLAALDETLI